MLNFSFHFKELKFRFFYCLLSWFFTFCFVYCFFEDVLFSLSSSIPTFFIYNSALEVLITKASLAFLLSAWLLFPHLVASLWLFGRSGLHEYEASLGPSIYTLLLSLIIPWLIYYLALDFLAWTLQNFSSYFYRFLPSLNSTTSFIANLLFFSNLLYIFPRIFSYFLLFADNVFKKLRLIVIYFITALATWVLPPDIVYLALALSITVFTLEGLFYIHLLFSEYSRLQKERYLIGPFGAIKKEN